MQLTPLQALELLDVATQPQNIARLTRADFVNVNAALQLLYGILAPQTEADPVEKEFVDYPTLKN